MATCSASEKRKQVPVRESRLIFRTEQRRKPCVVAGAPLWIQKNKIDFESLRYGQGVKPAGKFSERAWV
jgi:hypothetical protein